MRRTTTYRKLAQVDTLVIRVDTEEGQATPYETQTLERQNH